MTTTRRPASPPRALHPVRRLDVLGVPLALGVAWLLGAGGADAVAIVPLAAAAALAPALARVDVAERRLPNALTLPLLLVGVAAAVLRLAQGDLAPLVALGCALVLLAMAVSGGMGMGEPNPEIDSPHEHTTASRPLREDQPDG